MNLYLMEDIETGEIKYYSKKKNMCEIENLTGRLVTYVLNNKRNHHKGYTFRKFDVPTYDDYEVEDIVDIDNGIVEEDNSDNNRIMTIGDLHAPFTLEGYLDFCKYVYDKYDINKVIFMGDIIDNHYSSYHETDPSGYNADDEFDLAREIIQEYYKAFPNATVLIGNHDAIILRKFKTAGLSKNWVKDFKISLGTPNWKYVNSLLMDDIFFYHGVGRKPRLKAKDEGMSCVAGHYHSESYVHWYQNAQGRKWFALQVGTGIDKDNYAFDYAKHGKTAQLNVGIIINGVPKIIPYKEV